MSILENARQSVEYDAPVPLKVAQALTELASVAQEVVDGMCVDLREGTRWWKVEPDKEDYTNLESLAAKLEEVKG